MDSEGMHPPHGPTQEDAGTSGAMAVVARALSEQVSEQRELARIVAGVEESLAGLQSHLAALDEHLQAATGGGEERDAALGDRLRVVEEALLDVQRGREQSQGQLRDLAERLGRVDAHLADVRAEVAERDQAAASLLESAQARLTTEAQRVAEAQRTLAREASGAAQQLQTVLDLTAARQEDGLGTLHEAAARLDARSRESADELRAVTEAVGSDLAARVQDATVAVSEATARLRDELATALEETRVQLSAAAADSGQEMAGSLIQAVEAARADLASDLASVRAGMDDGARAMSDRAAALDDAVAEARRLLDTVPPAVEAAAEQVRATFDERADAEHRQLDEVASALRASADEAAGTLLAVGDRLDAARAEEEARAARSEEAAAELRDAIRADAAEALRDLRGDIEQVLAGVDARIAAAVQRATDEARMVAAEEAGRVRDELAGSIAALNATADQVSGARAGIEELRTGLVGYLEERDQALERDRAQLLIDLLDELAEDMSRKDARRLAGQAAEARDRARDRRDADRFRDLAARDLLRHLPGAAPPGATRTRPGTEA